MQARESSHCGPKARRNVFGEPHHRSKKWGRGWDESSRLRGLPCFTNHCVGGSYQVFAAAFEVPDRCLIVVGALEAVVRGLVCQGWAKVAASPNFTSATP